jgi:hypothetical protein
MFLMDVTATLSSGNKTAVAMRIGWLMLEGEPDKGTGDLGSESVALQGNGAPSGLWATCSFSHSSNHLLSVNYVSDTIIIRKGRQVN